MEEATTVNQYISWQSLHFAVATSKMESVNDSKNSLAEFPRVDPRLHKAGNASLSMSMVHNTSVRSLHREKTSQLALPGQSSFPQTSKTSGDHPERASRRSIFGRLSRQQPSVSLFRVKELFRECIQADRRLSVDHYIQAYKEVNKFLHSMGTILSFASRDVESKVHRMVDLMSADIEGLPYRYLDSLLAYEIDMNIVTADGKECRKSRKGMRSGTRIMFRLHQALAFIVKIFSAVCRQPTVKICKIAHEAYRDTISKNHNWFVRKTAGLAFHTIPSRRTLIHSLGNESEVTSDLEDISKMACKIYELTSFTFDQYSTIAANEPKTLEMATY